MRKCVVSALLLLCLAGCNTIGGFGRDLKHAGDYISDSANTR